MVGVNLLAASLLVEGIFKDIRLPFFDNYVDIDI